LCVFQHCFHNSSSFVQWRRNRGSGGLMNRGSRAPVGSERDILVLQYCSKTIKTVGGNGFAPDPTVTTEACSTAPGSVAGGEGACCPTAKLHSCSQPFGI